MLNQKLESFTQLSLFQNYATPLRDNVNQFFDSLPKPHYFFSENNDNTNQIIIQVNDVVMMTEEERSKATAICAEISLADCPDDCVGLDIDQQVKQLEEKLQILSMQINGVKE